MKKVLGSLPLITQQAGREGGYQSFRQWQYTAGTENICVVKFQCLINYTLTSGKFANLIFKN